MSFSHATLEPAATAFMPDPDGLLEPDWMHSPAPDLDYVLTPDLSEPKSKAKPKHKKRHHRKHHRKPDTSRNAFMEATMAKFGETRADYEHGHDTSREGFMAATMAQLPATPSEHDESAFAHYAD